ncbi:MAG: winged helix-turn-helix domain-containing protein, partial [Treponema sp.]|nr:winged helix-turn-helix domain-containing protein [Treponema sp.]
DMEDALKFTVYRKNGDKTSIKSKNGDKTAIKSKNGDKTAIKSERKNAKTLILEYLGSHQDATGKEIGEMLGLKASRTKFYLNELETEGKIMTSGANKNRLYMLKKGALS